MLFGVVCAIECAKSEIAGLVENSNLRNRLTIIIRIKEAYLCNGSCESNSSNAGAPTSAFFCFVHMINEMPFEFYHH